MMIPNNTEYMFAVVVLITLTLWCVSVHHASQHQCDFPLWLTLGQTLLRTWGQLPSNLCTINSGVAELILA